ncbi:hypothetical protein M231_06520 [Tremella mesenterica]|uniref:NmrA-like domain-containing protein n=1 Tax=Tremella mesenterica TaxID=5217 RepID=A0A4V1M3B1_TREME|nr:uncharacterized protein TREMEDRAFT_30282 [Tremella mesenterica DSM 1558]EIW70046.1 hypothetical protein TREMEDRAFT_30282 [Tremella mesenterica DSM 1558]RXK36250.1 hypothetical protein M231_06520 [Tremella mesenterica]
MSKSIFVFTVTGEQGSSVAKYMLEAEWQVSGLTRNLESESAKKLAESGVKLLKGDLADRASYEHLLKGHDAVFVNADFWTVYTHNGYNGDEAGKEETRQAMAAIDACNQAGIPHIVYSTLEGEDIPHWQSKHLVNEWIREHNIPVTQLYTSSFNSNMYRFDYLKSDGQGGLLLNIQTLDDARVPTVSSEQMGAWVKTAVENPEEWKGKNMYACTDYLTVKEMAHILSEYMGKKVDTPHLTPEALESDVTVSIVGFEIWCQNKVWASGTVIRDVEESKRIAPGVWTFKEWCEKSEKFHEYLAQLK